MRDNSLINASYALLQSSCLDLQRFNGECVTSVSYQILVGHGAESPQKDADNGHVIVPRCHMQTRIPQLQTGS